MNLKNNTTIKDFFKITAWTLKKTLSTSIAYWILLFISLPLLEIIILSTKHADIELYYNTKDCIYSASDLFINQGTIKELTGTGFTAIVILFSAIFTFMALHYMHGKRITDFFGSLPVTKTTMFFARVFSAAISTIIPMVVTILLSMLILFNADGIRPFLSLMVKLTIYALFNVVFISVICLSCGTTVNSIIKYLLINAAMPVTAILIAYMPTLIMPGMSEPFITGSNLTFFATIASPIIAPFLAIFGTSKWWFYLVWIIFIIALISFGKSAVLKRKAESAQSTDVSNWSDKTINFIFNFACGILVGLIFSIFFLNESQHIAFALGCLVGSFVPHFLLHIIKCRSLTGLVKSLLRVYAPSIVLIYIVSGIFLTGGFGYVNNIPELEDIKSVSFASVNPNEYYDNNIFSGLNNDAPINYLPTFEDNETINLVHDLHSLILDELPDETLLPIHDGLLLPEAYYANYIYIRYNLNNGKTITRCYSLSNDYGYDYESFSIDITNKYRKIVDKPEYNIQATGLHLLPNDAVKKIKIDRMVRTKNNRSHSFSDNGESGTFVLQNDNATGNQFNTILEVLRSETNSNIDLLRNSPTKYDKDLKPHNSKIYYRIKVIFKKSIVKSRTWFNYTEKYIFTKDEAPELAKIVAPLTE